MTNADWYLIRSSGVVSLVLLTAVMALGIASSNRWRIGAQPRFVTTALHRSLSLLSVVFLAIHVVTTLLDPYAAVSLLATLLPFARAANALWIGIGAVSLDLVIALIVTSLLRARLGYRTWRLTHWLAYLSWPLAFAHSVGMGSDASTRWFQVTALGCLAFVTLALVSRLLTYRPGKRLEPQVTP
ncbi:MAG TPA: ferric reductase-like transmembrane domain-containing protein [Gaiellaceae bacterium]|nr:ferric reductase-like transmembrane domain-containing protein [Gaiellaceae bacterium]